MFILNASYPTTAEHSYGFLATFAIRVYTSQNTRMIDSLNQIENVKGMFSRSLTSRP